MGRGPTLEKQPGLLGLCLIDIEVGGLPLAALGLELWDIGTEFQHETMAVQPQE
jgi:hypothetical protein